MDVFSKSVRINKALKEMRIFSYVDALRHLPRRYEDYSSTKETDLVDKQRVVAVGKLISTPVTNKFGKLYLTKFTFLTNKNNIFYCEAWNRPYLFNILKLEEEIYTLIGSYDAKKKIVNVININKGFVEDGNFLKPVYSLPTSLDNHEFIRIIKTSFANTSKNDVYDTIPLYYRKKYRIVNKYDAYRLLHQPDNFEDIRQGNRYFKYEECLKFALKNQIIRYNNKLLSKVDKTPIDEEKVKEFISFLPFTLTKDQEIVVGEILSDMNNSSLMNRLLQGDVGSGKTLVAAIASYANFVRGDQTAFMAPTDALARQHFKNLVQIFKNTDIKIALLLGSTSTKERAIIRQGLINNEINLIVGTHVLFSKDISYLSLGLAVIDEQHKFGVNQRETLASKGDRADLLLMSATPIPRTLALTLYGDMDVSTITTFPFKERKIETFVVKDNDERINKVIEESLANNKKIFVVTPLIEEKSDDEFSVEKLYARYLLKYPGKVSILHGRLDDDDKLFALDDFYKGITPIIVSTTVIEVGIDVKDADLMIIYDATHFGLATLHQLRGRIGRDGKPSKCFLVSNSSEEEELEKLNVLVKSNDGFYVSSEDLRLRGPGELLGVKQSGIANFNYVNLVNDYRIFEVARDDAKYILDNKDELGFRYIVSVVNKEIEKSSKK